MRSWCEDWEMCERTSGRPWLYSGGRRFDPARWSKAGFDMHCVTVDHENGRWEAIFTKTLDQALFIAESREALPYWLQRVKELEERLKVLEQRRCEACKWWNKFDYLLGWGECRKAGFWSLSASDPECRFLVMERDEFGRGLRTRSDFGCVCWEAKEAQT